MLPSFMAQPQTRKRYPLVSDHGNEVRDYAGVPDEAVFYGSVQPGTGTEDVEEQLGLVDPLDQLPAGLRDPVDDHHVPAQRVDAIARPLAKHPQVLALVESLEQLQQ